MYPFISTPIAHAQLALPDVVEPVASGATLLTFVCTLVFQWVFTAAIILAILLVLVAAFKYMTAADTPAKIESANKTLMFVAIGIAVAIMARSVPVIVGSFVAGEAKLDPCVGTTPTTPTT